jgi:hypothetical protein
MYFMPELLRISLSDVRIFSLQNVKNMEAMLRLTKEAMKTIESALFDEDIPSVYRLL